MGLGLKIKEELIMVESIAQGLYEIMVDNKNISKEPQKATVRR